MRGLERRLLEGKPIDDVWSATSLFVSRVDTKLDKTLDELISKAQEKAERNRLEALKGKAVIANAKIAYQ